jgi:hypothetical protein
LVLVPRPPNANIVSGKWIFKHKHHSDGSLARHKARWVVRGFSHQYDIDYNKSFSPVVKPAIIRVVLSIAASHAWPIHQLDVKNVFLHVISMRLSTASSPLVSLILLHLIMFVCSRNLYMDSSRHLKHGTSASPPFIQTLGFVASVSDSSLFVYKEGISVAYLLLYVDDIVLTASSTALLQQITKRLHSEFAMTDLGDLHHFLGISVTRSPAGLFLSQR